jgi:hypothetical protein
VLKYHSEELMPVSKGWQGKVQIDGDTLGNVADVSVDISNNLNPVRVFNNRGADQISLGIQEVTGSISHLWLDFTLAGYGISSGTTVSNLPDFNMWLYPAGLGTSGYPYLFVSGVKLDTHGISTPQDDFAMEDVDFIGKYAYHYGNPPVG